MMMLKVGCFVAMTKSPSPSPTQSLSLCMAADVLFLCVSAKRNNMNLKHGMFGRWEKSIFLKLISAFCNALISVSECVSLQRHFKFVVNAKMNFFASLLWTRKSSGFRQHVCLCISLFVPSHQPPPRNNIRRRSFLRHDPKQMKCNSLVYVSLCLPERGGKKRQRRRVVREWKVVKRIFPRNGIKVHPVSVGVEMSLC